MRLFPILNIILFTWVMLGSLVLIYFQNFDGVIVHVPLTLKVDALTLKTDKPVYKPGDTVYVQISFCKNYEYTSTTSWNLVNSIIRPFPAKAYTIPVGCVGPEWFPVVKIPTDDAFVGDGIYHLEGTTQIEVNPLRTVYYYFKTENFQITPNV
jgi:hypothetical protein